MFHTTTVCLNITFVTFAFPVCMCACVGFFCFVSGREREREREKKKKKEKRRAISTVRTVRTGNTSHMISSMLELDTVHVTLERGIDRPAEKKNQHYFVGCHIFFSCNRWVCQNWLILIMSLSMSSSTPIGAVSII